MSQIQVSICIDDTHLSQVQQIAEQLKSSGMTVEQVLETIGIVTGSIESDRVNNLHKIEGVQNVELQEIYRI